MRWRMVRVVGILVLMGGQQKCPSLQNEANWLQSGKCTTVLDVNVHRPNATKLGEMFRKRK